jgi:hypothetical protein
MTDQTPVAATPRRRWPENCELDDVEEIEQDDDRNWDADQPQENTAHGFVSDCFSLPKRVDPLRVP